MKVVINPKYAVLSSFVMSIHDSFEHEGEIIYDERNKLKRFSVAGYDLIVKRFRKPHLINQIAYTFFRSSKAERSFQNALKLLEKGISTPSPIAYIEEKKAGILNFSYYICIYEQDFSHIRNQMFGEAVSDNFYKQLAKYIADSHDNGVLHLDLSPGNILVKKTDENFLFSIIETLYKVFQSVN